MCVQQKLFLQHKQHLLIIEVVFINYFGNHQLTASDMAVKSYSNLIWQALLWFANAKLPLWFICYIWWIKPSILACTRFCQVDSCFTLFDCFSSSVLYPWYKNLILFLKTIPVLGLLSYHCMLFMLTIYFIILLHQHLNFVFKKNELWKKYAK